MALSPKQPNLPILTDSPRDTPTLSTSAAFPNLPPAPPSQLYGSTSPTANGAPNYSQVAQVGYNKSKTIRTAVLIGDDDENATPRVYRRGTASHSVFYHLPLDFANLDDFLGPLRQSYPRGIGRQLKTKTEKTHTAIELCLSNDDYCKQACRDAIQVGDQQFLATPAISADLKLFRVNLSGLPADDYDDIAKQLRKCLSPFGNVRETIHCNRDPATNRHQKVRMNDNPKSPIDSRPVIIPAVILKQAQQVALEKAEVTRKLEAQHIIEQQLKAEANRIASEQQATEDAFKASLLDDEDDDPAPIDLENNIETTYPLIIDHQPISPDVEMIEVDKEKETKKTKQQI
ncbi:hypothetical protein CLU79DRAFT_717390 [Phycomyces nitens]|nr:hypothetical protein CLU79DRAFT_717390 [Phycomyces nitens]